MYRKVIRARPGFEPRTSRTLSENHTTRPNSLAASCHHSRHPPVRKHRSHTALLQQPRAMPERAHAIQDPPMRSLSARFAEKMPGKNSTWQVRASKHEAPCMPCRDYGDCSSLCATHRDLTTWLLACAHTLPTSPKRGVEFMCAPVSRLHPQRIINPARQALRNPSSGKAVAPHPPG